ncbi:MAG TPA: hypothetical protein VKQ34_05060 [Candidatus Saccharimonadales bacterium]|nr:hypothetical protein [Candidatus Saccharimonadales bacterium]
MAVFERSLQQRVIISSCIVALLGAALLFTVLMVWHANHLSGMVTTARSERVIFGPFTLAILSKTPASGGTYQVSIQLGVGMVWYMLFWLAAVIAVAAIRLRFVGRRE